MICQSGKYCRLRNQLETVIMSDLKGCLELPTITGWGWEGGCYFTSSKAAANNITPSNLHYSSFRTIRNSNSIMIVIKRIYFQSSKQPNSLALNPSVSCSRLHEHGLLILYNVDAKHLLQVSVQIKESKFTAKLWSIPHQL